MRAVALLVVVGFAAVFPVSARAQVAVAVTLPDNNPTHRDVAAAIVNAVDDAWLMLSPQLDPVDVAVCKTEFGCLQRDALARGASHLLVIGVAGLGTRDYVVSFQLYDARGIKLVDENTVQTASASPTVDGAGLASTLLRVPSMPKALPVAVAPAVPPGPTNLALTGVALVAGGGVVGVATAIAALSLAVEPSSAANRDGLITGTIAATSFAVLLGAAGVGCIVVDGRD
ncbi:MAG: hypothetical protein Q8O67_27615 [Deltaproteobacteria bacterium]|nr:hypothetical protein [Deltaproteobacteria bacterium]